MLTEDHINQLKAKYEALREEYGQRYELERARARWAPVTPWQCLRTLI